MKTMNQNGKFYKKNKKQNTKRKGKIYCLIGTPPNWYTPNCYVIAYVLPFFVKFLEKIRLKTVRKCPIIITF